MLPKNKGHRAKTMDTYRELKRNAYEHSKRCDMNYWEQQKTYSCTADAIEWRARVCVCVRRVEGMPYSSGNWRCVARCEADVHCRRLKSFVTKNGKNQTYGNGKAYLDSENIYATRFAIAFDRIENWEISFVDRIYSLRCIRQYQTLHHGNWLTMAWA